MQSITYWSRDPHKTLGYLKILEDELVPGWEKHIIGVIEMAAIVVKVTWAKLPMALAVFAFDHRHRSPAAWETTKEISMMRATWKKNNTLERYFVMEEPSKMQLGDKRSKSSMNN